MFKEIKDWCVKQYNDFIEGIEELYNDIHDWVVDTYTRVVDYIKSLFA